VACEKIAARRVAEAGGLSERRPVPIAEVEAPLGERADLSSGIFAQAPSAACRASLGEGQRTALPCPPPAHQPLLIAVPIGRPCRDRKTRMLAKRTW